MELSENNSVFLGEVVRYELRTPTFYFPEMTDEIQKETIQECLSVISDTKNCRIENQVTHTHFEDFEIKDYENYPKLELLYNNIINAISNSYENKLMKFSDMWIHPHHPRESTQQHNHGDWHMSYVFWLKIPKNAKSIFSFCIQDLDIHINPVEKHLMLFPGWAHHKVSRNLSDDIRISLSGNFEFLKEDSEYDIR